MAGLGERKGIFGKKELVMEKFIISPLIILLGIILIFITVNRLKDFEIVFLLIPIALIIIGRYEIYSGLKKQKKKK